ncbi:MAG: polyprenol monophosphomannose synthase [Planctomycetota bacterium]
MTRTLVATCTLNESDNIAEFLAAMRSAMPSADLLVVDDNSPDGTASLVRQFAEKDGNTFIVVRDARGLGGAVKAAMHFAIEGDYEIFCNLDADFSHPPKQLGEMHSMIENDASIDVLVGSRYVAGGRIEGWPWRRRMMSRMVNGIATRLVGLPVRDCSGSMRCYRVSKLRQLGMENLTSEGYAIFEELLLKLHRIESKFVEHPITFVDRELGQSKLTLGEAIKAVARMFTLALSRLRPAR